MLLKWEHYNSDVHYKKGTKMYIADFLSGAALQYENMAIEQECENLNNIENTERHRNHQPSQLAMCQFQGRD